MASARSDRGGTADAGSVRFRDLMVLHGTSCAAARLSRERPEVDTQRLGVRGHELGRRIIGWRWRRSTPLSRRRVAGRRIDDRISATALPELVHQFRPYIRPPKLLLNGRDDEEDPWLTRGLPLWNLLREPKQLVLIRARAIWCARGAVSAINSFFGSDVGAGPRAP